MVILWLWTRLVERMVWVVVVGVVGLVRVLVVVYM